MTKDYKVGTFPGIFKNPKIKIIDITSFLRIYILIKF